MNEVFRKLAAKVSLVAGSPASFVLALGIIVIWVVSGPNFNFSDTWQLVINTGTTIVTFLMVFLIQNTQNRDSKAMQIKLDELLRGVKGARTGLVNIEDLPDDQLEQLHEQFRNLHEHYSKEMIRRKRVTKPEEE